MRTRKPGRLRDIGIAARVVFTRQGYRLTQMADVAREAGVSAGALYSYVDGKEALFELALIAAAGLIDAAEEAEGRFVPAGLAATIERLRDFIVAASNWPEINGALAREAVAPAAVGPVIGELFDWLGPQRHLIWLLDRCSAEVPGLDGVYQAEVRGRYMADLAQLVGRASGDADGQRAAMRARGLMEATVWLAMHRHRDRQPPAGDDALARATAVEMAVAAVTGWRGG